MTQTKKNSKRIRKEKKPRLKAGNFITDDDNAFIKEERKALKKETHTLAAGECHDSVRDGGGCGGSGSLNDRYES